MNRQEQLQAFKQMAAVAKNILQEDTDAAVYLTDTEKCIAYYPGNTVEAGIRSGDKIREDETAYEVIHRKRRIHQQTGKQASGVALEEIGYPIVEENGDVAGAFILVKKVGQKSAIEAETQNLFASVEKVSTSVGEVADHTQQLAGNLESIQTLSQATTQDIQKADTIVGSIQSVASQSNLLALNATIEAARVGAAGRAFSVVAEEMKNLAKTSKESADAVATMLNGMKVSIENISRQIESLAEKSKTQTSETEQILSAIEEVTKSSEKLLTLVK